MNPTRPPAQIDRLLSGPFTDRSGRNFDYRACTYQTRATQRVPLYLGITESRADSASIPCPLMIRILLPLSHTVVEAVKMSEPAELE